MSYSSLTSSSLMTNWSWFLLFFLSFLWGFSFFFNEVMLDHFPPAWITSLRLLLGGVMGLFLLIMLGSSCRYGFLMWLKMLCQGMLGAGLPFLLIVMAQQEINSGHAAILNGLTPLFGIIVSHYLVSGDRMTWNRVLGVIMGILGVLIMFWESIISGWGEGVLAQLMILFSCLCYALGGVFTRRMGLLEVDFPTLVFVKLTGAGVLVSIWAYFSNGMIDYGEFFNLDLLFATLTLGFFCTGLAFFIFYNILQRSGSNVFFCTLIVPWIALLLGYLFLGEKLDSNQISGMLIIMLSLIFIDERFLTLFTMLARGR